MSVQTPALLVTVPLLAASLAAASGLTRRAAGFYLAALGLAAAVGCAVDLVVRVAVEGPVDYFHSGWPPPWGIAYRVDHLNAVVLLVVSAAALANLISAKKMVDETQGTKANTFYAVYVLAVCGLLGMVVTADAFNLYVLLEISSLSGYALLARGGDRAPLAVLNYVLLGTIGASFYLLGVGFLYIKTGTLNMSDLAVRMTPLYESPAISAAFLLILVGLWLKSAFFPLHLWLPQAYTHGNTAAVGLFAPLMTKVMIFIMIRFMVTVFTPYFAFVSLDLADLIVWLATAAVVAGALLALAQKDFKKMLSYVIVTEVGYMIGGAWLGNRAGMTGAVLHVLFDALMTLCVFLAVAAISYRIKSMRIQDFQGLFGRMPLTMSGLAVGALSIIGVPPACGFWSKWYLVSGAIQAGHWPFAVVLLFSSLVAVVLFFRVFEIAFFEPANAGGHGHGPVRRREAPWSMILPLWVTAGALIAAGFLTGPLVRTFVEPAIGSPL